MKKEKWTHKIYLSIYFVCFIECIHAKWSVRFNSNTFLHALIVHWYYIAYYIWKKKRVFSHYFLLLSITLNQTLNERNRPTLLMHKIDSTKCKWTTFSNTIENRTYIKQRPFILNVEVSGWTREKFDCQSILITSKIRVVSTQFIRKTEIWFFICILLYKHHSVWIVGVKCLSWAPSAFRKITFDFKETGSHYKSRNPIKS